MALQGTLDSFSLPDVLRLLADTGKTGRLDVEGDRGQGSVWMADGALVGASAERALNDAAVHEVVFEMLRFGSGSFNFAADERTEDAQSPADVEGVLRQAGELLNEWRELEAVVPSLDHRVAIAPQLTVDKVTIDAARWKTLVALAGGLTVGELGQSLTMSELDVSRTVSDLVELGVAVVEEPSRAARRAASSSRRNSSRESRNRRISQSGERQNGTRTAAADRVDTYTNGQDTNGDEPTPRRGREREREERPAPTGRRAGGSSGRSSVGNGASAAGNSIPRRSRSTGQRTPRSMSSPGSAPAPVAAAPPTPEGRSGVAVSPLSGSDQGLASLPPFNNSETGPGMGGALDAGQLGPSPMPVNTGQGPAIEPSSLPPDLNWAVEEEDTQAVPPSLLPSPSMVGATSAPMSPPVGSPAPPVPSFVPQGAAPMQGHDGDVAPHVSVLSPNARYAVEATVGPAGGGSGVVPAAGASQEEQYQRSALLGFLSSTHH